MATFYASPTGSAGNNGTIGSPWSLAHVAGGAGGALAGGGHVVLFLNGTYNIAPPAQLNFTVSGTASAPIMLCPAPGASAALNGGLLISGSHLLFVGMRITWLHDTIRTTTTPGSTPADVPRAVTGVTLVTGVNVRFIECMVYDHAGGLFSASSAENFQALDNICYNNGWTGPDRGHGHGFYCQNNGVTRQRLRGNMLFCNGSTGIKIGGTSGSLLLRFDVLDNAAFNNQLPGYSLHGLDSCFQHDGGSNNKGDTVVRGNFFAQQHDPSAFAFEIGDNNPGDFPVTVTDNVMLGRTLLNEWPSLTFRRNVLTDFPVFADANIPIGLLRTPNNASYDIDQNTYATRATGSPFNSALILAATGRTFAAWQSLSPYDDNTTFIDGPLTNAIVRVVPTQYRATRDGSIYVLNPTGAANVTVDLGPLYAEFFGYPFAIYHVYDYVTGGAPTVEGTYTGQRITLPMTSKTPPQPFGGAPLPTQDNTFGAFVVTTRPGYTPILGGGLG